MIYKQGNFVYSKDEQTIGIILGSTFRSNEYWVAFYHHTRATSAYGCALEPVINLHADLDGNSRNYFEVLEELLSR